MAERSKRQAELELCLSFCPSDARIFIPINDFGIPKKILLHINDFGIPKKILLHINDFGIPKKNIATYNNVY